MLVKNFIKFLAFVGVSRASSVCGFNSASPCDLSASHVCCNNYESNTCCNFDPNGSFGSSVLCADIPDSDECAGYGDYDCAGGDPVFTIVGPGCIHGQYATPSAAFFYQDSKRVKRDGDCRTPNVGVYYKEGIQRKVAIPPGNYSHVLQWLTEDNYTQLDLLEEYRKSSLTVI